MAGLGPQEIYFFSKLNLLYIGSAKPELDWLTDENSQAISSVSFLGTILYQKFPDLIIYESLLSMDLQKLWKNERLLPVPVLVLQHDFDNVEDLVNVANRPRILMCNTSVAADKRFSEKLLRVAQKKEEILPVHSGLIVKKTILYLNKNKEKKVSRRELADHCSVSVDYLTRIFKKEMGINLTDYVEIYKLDMACMMLRETGYTVAEIAARTGWKDAAYFSRVFHKAFGKSPSDFRK